MSHQMQPSDQLASAAHRLFDLRVMIGGLFVTYGVVLIAAGLVAGSYGERKASGININLDMGIGMLVVGLLFLAWWRLRPLRPAAQTVDTGTRSHPEP